MKIFTKETIVNNNKNIKNAKILCFSDLHYSKKLGFEFIKSLADYIILQKPDYCCFLGDICNDNDFQPLLYFFLKISEFFPVIIVNGNRDIDKFLVGDMLYHNEYYFPECLKEFLAKFDNIYFLNNSESVTIDNFCFTGIDFFHKDSSEIMIDKLNNKVPKLNEDNFNVLLSHNPLIMSNVFLGQLDKEYLKNNLILSGHQHNGLVPIYMDNMFPGTTGLFCKDGGLLPKNTRGETQIIMDGKVIDEVIIPPIRTFSNETVLFNTLNNLYPPAMKLIKVKKY